MVAISHGLKQVDVTRGNVMQEMMEKIAGEDCQRAEKYAPTGDVVDQYTLGNCYISGWGMAQNNAEGRRKPSPGIASSKRITPALSNGFAEPRTKARLMPWARLPGCSWKKRPA